MADLAVGDVAPDFDVRDTQGRRQCLADLVRTNEVILAFFPMAFTPGCTRELTSYREHAADAIARGAHVIAISGDGEGRQERFRKALGADYSFVADPRAEVIKAYGAKLPLVNYAKRMTFVIGRDKRIKMIEKGPDAKDPTRALATCSMGS